MALSTPSVPSSTTGTEIMGMKVARQFCRKMNMTRATSTMASASVLSTSLIEARTKGVESELTKAVMPSGK